MYDTWLFKKNNIGIMLYSKEEIWNQPISSGTGTIVVYKWNDTCQLSITCSTILRDYMYWVDL